MLTDSLLASAGAPFAPKHVLSSLPFLPATQCERPSFCFLWEPDCHLLKTRKLLDRVLGLGGGSGRELPPQTKKLSTADTTTDRGKVTFLHWSFTGNINHARGGPVPSTRWAAAQHEVRDVFEDVLSHVRFFGLFFCLIDLLISIGRE